MSWKPLSFYPHFVSFGARDVLEAICRKIVCLLCFVFLVLLLCLMVVVIMVVLYVLDLALTFDSFRSHCSAQIVASCEMDLHMFPLDTQECYLHYGSCELRPINKEIKHASACYVEI